MKNILSVVSAIAAIFSLLMAIYVYVQTREDQSKKLKVELIANSTLVNANLSNHGDKIEILYDGKKIENFSILQFRISNSGAQPVLSTDYESPIKLTLSNISSVLSAEFIVSDPPSLPIKINTFSDSIVLSKALLNPSDWFTIEVGVTPIPQKKIAVEASGRVVGVKRIIFENSVLSLKKEEGLSVFYKKIVIIQSLLFVVILGAISILMRRLAR